MQLITISHGDTQLTTPDANLALQVLAGLASVTHTPAITTLIVPPIGTYWEGQGGVYVGVMRGENGTPDYHLIFPTHESVMNKKLKWGGYDVDEPESSSRRDGLANTLHLVEGSAQEHPAASWCDGLKVEGHSDLYLPAIDELALGKANASEIFDKEWHWSSSQRSAHTAFGLDFEDGCQDDYGKLNELRVRPVRRFLQ